MSFLGGLFKDKKTTTTDSTQNASQSYGMSPLVSDYWSTIAGQFGPNAWRNIGPSEFQTTAAGAQSGLSMAPVVGGALGIGASGLDPASIARYQSPYTQQVVDATRAEFADTNAKAQAQDMAFAAKAGVPLLNGTQTGVTRALGQGERETAQSAVIANLYDKGFSTAAGLAGQDLQARLAALQAAGQGITAQSGINQGLFGMGSGLWSQELQNQMAAAQRAQQGAQVFGSLVPLSGNNTTGASTGTQATTGSPSPFSTIANVAGLGLTAYGAGLFSDERVKENIVPIGETYDGQPIYKYNYKDSPQTTIGLLAQDVEGRVPEAVGSVAGIKTVDYDVATKKAERGRPMAGGGSVAPPKAPDAMEKFARAYESISGMLQRSRGGSVAHAGRDSGLVPLRAAGGPVGSWETTVTPASPGVDWKALGQGVSKLGQAPSAADGGTDLLAQQQASLSQLMSSTSRPVGRATGGGAWGETGPEWESERPSGLSSPMFVGAGAEPVERRAMPPPHVIEAIKGFEGYRPRAYSDYKQHSVGYGTRASHPDEVIDKAEAERRLASEVGRAQEIVDRFAPNLDPGTRAALTSLTYNAGADWQKAGLGDAIRRGDMADARSRLMQYTKAGGEELPGLVSRRQAEAAWMGSPDTGGVVSAPAPTMAAAQRAPDEKSWIQRFLPGSGEGVLSGKPMTGLDRLGVALMKVRGPLFESMTGGVADAVLDMNKARIAEQENERAAQRFADQLRQQREIAIGSINGQSTLDARRIEADAAERKRAADFAKQRELGVVDGQQTLDARRVDAETAERTARQTGHLPDGSLTQQGMLNEQAIAKAKMQREMDELKLADIKEPEKLYARRKALADKYGLKEGTAEYTNWIFDGKVPDRTSANESTTQKEVAKAEVEMAQKAIASGAGAKDVIRVVDQLRALPETKNFENAIGPLDDFRLWQSVAGSIPILNALTNPSTSAEIKRLQSQLELAGGEKMKGLGAQSDKDAERLANAVSGLSSARNATEYYAALRVIEESVTSAYNRAVEAGKKFPALGGSDFSNATPRQMKPSPHQALIEAREAIRRGAPKEAVAAELRKMGVDPGGL